MNKFLLFIFLAVKRDDKNKTEYDQKDWPGGMPVDFGDVTPNQAKDTDADEYQSSHHVAVLPLLVVGHLKVGRLVHVGSGIHFLCRHDDPKDDVDEKS